jgi:hypothetical protein
VVSAGPAVGRAWVPTLARTASTVSQSAAPRLARAAGNTPSCGRGTVREGVRLLGEQFGRRRAPGLDLAVQALATAMPEETIRAVATGYTPAMLSAYERALA